VIFLRFLAATYFKSELREKGHNPMTSAVVRVCNGGLGQNPWWEVRGKVPLKLKHFGFGHSMKAANLPIFLKCGNGKKSDICVVFAKIMRGHETGGGAKLGACTPSARA